MLNFGKYYKVNLKYIKAATDDNAGITQPEIEQSLANTNHNYELVSKTHNISI